MANIPPMTTKQPMGARDLERINRTGGRQTLQDLRQPDFGRSPGSARQGGSPQPQTRTSPPQGGSSQSQTRTQPPPGRSPQSQTRTAPPPGRSPQSQTRTAPPPGRSPQSQTRTQPPPGGSPQPPVRTPPKRPHPPVTGTVLQKGQKISLTQLAPGLEQVDVGLGWDLAPGSAGYDLDVEAFLLGPDGRVPGDDWFVFYNQPVSPDGAVRLAEAAPAGAPGDDGMIRVDLRRLSPQAVRIAFIVTINEARERGHNFGGVSAAYARVTDRASGRELVRFPLRDFYSNVYSMVVGELYRYKDEWRFNPVGNGTGDDLAGLCVRYGVDV